MSLSNIETITFQTRDGEITTTKTVIDSQSDSYIGKIIEYQKKSDGKYFIDVDSFTLNQIIDYIKYGYLQSDSEKVTHYLDAFTVKPMKYKKFSAEMDDERTQLLIATRYLQRTELKTLPCLWDSSDIFNHLTNEEIRDDIFQARLFFDTKGERIKTTAKTLNYEGVVGDLLLIPIIEEADDEELEDDEDLLHPRLYVYVVLKTHFENLAVFERYTPYIVEISHERIAHNMAINGEIKKAHNSLIENEVTPKKDLTSIIKLLKERKIYHLSVSCLRYSIALKKHLDEYWMQLKNCYENLEP